MRKLTHHRRKTSLPAVTRVIFCPAKQRFSGETFAQNNFVRPNANPPDVLSFSAIIESTKIRKIHRSGRVYMKATVANELWRGGGRVSFTKPMWALAGRGHGTFCNLLIIRHHFRCGVELRKGRNCWVVPPVWFLCGRCIVIINTMYYICVDNIKSI